MKKLILLGMLFIGFLSYGQQMTDEEKAAFKAEIKEKFQALNLSEEQKSKFEQIQTKYFDKMMEIQDSDKGRISKMKSLKAMQETKNEEVKAIMDKDQYKKYLEIQKEVREKMKEQYMANRNG